MAQLVENLHLRILYGLATSENRNGACFLARHRPIPVAVFDEEVDGQLAKFARAPLREILAAVCQSSPELMGDPTKDHSMYACDPLETLPTPLASTSSTQFGSGVAIGMGLMKEFLAQSAEQTQGVSVTGKLVHDRAVGDRVVEVIISFREIQSRNYQPYPTHTTAGATATTYPFVRPGSGVVPYGTTPLTAAPPECGSTTRSEPRKPGQLKKKKTKPTATANVGASSAARSTPAPSSSSFAALKSTPAPSSSYSQFSEAPGSQGDPIVVEDEESRGLTAPEVTEAWLKNIASQLAQVDNPAQRKVMDEWMKDTPLLAAALAKSAQAVADGSAASASEALLAALIPKLNGTDSTQKTIKVPNKMSHFKSRPTVGNFAAGVDRMQRAAETYYPHLMAKNEEVVPSSDPIPPSSPTPGARSLSSAYYRKSPAKSKAAIVLQERSAEYYRGASQTETEEGEADIQDFMGDDLELQTEPTTALANRPVPWPPASSRLDQPTRIVTPPSPAKKKKKLDGNDENAMPTPSINSIFDIPSEKRRRRSDSRSEDEPTTKKVRNALGQKDENQKNGLGLGGEHGLALPGRPVTPPPQQTPQLHFTPRASNLSLDENHGSLFTPSPRKTPARFLLSMTPGRTLDSIPATGFTPIFTPWKNGFLGTPRSLGNMGLPPTPTRGGAAGSLYSFEDGGVDAGLDWFDFSMITAVSSTTSMTMGQKSSDAPASSDGANSNGTETQSLSSSMSRWADLPPSSPPPPTSPVQLSSDLDFDFDENETPSSSQLTTDDEMSRTTTPNPEGLSSSQEDSGMSDHEHDHGDMGALEINVNPAELFASLGIPMAHTFPDPDDALNILRNINFDDPSVIESLNNIKGCVL